MVVAVWLVGLVLLALWSLTMWAAHAAWGVLSDLPWDQAAERVRSLQLPPALEVWLGSAWREWIDAMAPLIEWLVRLLQGSAGWLQEAVPVLIWGVWGLGSLALLVLTAVAAGAVGWVRRRRTRARYQV